VSEAVVIQPVVEPVVEPVVKPKPVKPVKPVKPALRIPQEKTQTIQPVKPNIHDIDVAVFVLSRRSAFETRQVIRQTWASGHKNVFFAVGKCCSIPPDDREKYTCARSKSSSASSQTSWDAQCAAQDKKLANEQQHYTDIITMPEVDVYRHLPQKVKYCYKWGLKHTEAKWFVKTDDDSVVRIDTLGAYLEKTYNSNNPMVIGKIAKGWGVPRSGKWAETDYKPSKYPNFPLGSVGHVVSNSVATYIVDNSDKLFNYQGEDVSIGIWLNESPLKVKWVTSKRMTNHGNCKDTGMWVIGHNIKPAKMKACFAHRDETLEKNYVGVNLVGGLGNNLFMLASTIGIARKNNAIPCYTGTNKASNLVTLDVKKCPQTYVKQSEKGYAKYTPFKIKKSTTVGTYLQSYKYFKSPLFEIKQNMNSFGHDYVKKHSNKATTVGIHVRRGDHLKYGYLNFPDDQYFKNAMQYFTDKYGDVQFFVASNDIPWCKKQSLFKDAHLVSEKHTAAQDMAILANCNHVIISIGTFGWWGGLLSGGEVVYSSEEFNLNHKINKGNVIKDDYYPALWKPLLSSPVVSPVVSTQSYSTIVTAYFELRKSKHSKSDYDTWMRNMLSLKDAMIIFTSPLLVPKIRALRAHAKSKTKIISMQLEDSKMVSDYSIDFWKNQVSIDPEKYHSSELYIIWQEKTNFLKRAKDLNPFGSEFFAWVDVGYFRTKKHNNQVIIKKIPDDLRFDQVMFLDASSLVKGLSKQIIGDGKYLGGGFIGGFSKGIDLWNAAYYNYLHSKKSEFIGIDQPRYYQTCMLNIGLCKIVQPKSGYGDPWFFMAHYLSTTNDALSSQCLQNLGMNMPIDKNGVMKAHHWDARTGKWNEEKRWLPMNLVAPCMIWYVGANTHGRDGVRLQKDYSCDIHVFEPVPSFANVLKKNWKNVPRSTVHAFGLGSESKQVEHVHVVGESTFAMSGGTDSSGETVHIKSIVEAWGELGKPSIDLLHINCEGCEWEMLETMISSGIVNKVRILQVGTHWFANVKNIQQRYCNIESKLSATHTKKFQQYFGWERWETRAPMQK
jgi:galactoside 2-L-fucosyltransferase 1/2